MYWKKLLNWSKTPDNEKPVEIEGIKISSELGLGQPKFATELAQEEKPQA